MTVTVFAIVGCSLGGAAGPVYSSMQGAKIGISRREWKMRLVLSVAACLFVTAAVAQQSEVKVVAAEDIAAGTKKYEGKEIELRKVRCYYADVSDYRCVTDARAVVFTESISNEDARSYIEEQCDSVKKVFARSSNCVMNIRFVYQNVEHDTISGNERRTIVRPDSVEAILPRKKR